MEQVESSDMCYKSTVEKYTQDKSFHVIISDIGVLLTRCS